MLSEMKILLSKIKDLGETDVILNIKLMREGNGGGTLMQSQYVEKVLRRFRFSVYKHASTPYALGALLKKNRRIARD